MFRDFGKLRSGSRVVRRRGVSAIGNGVANIGQRGSQVRIYMTEARVRENSPSTESARDGIRGVLPEDTLLWLKFEG